MKDVDLKTWYRLFPELQPKTEERACRCGRPWAGWKSFLVKDMAGLEAATCECGMPGLAIMQPRTAEANERWMQALGAFMAPKPKKKQKPKPKLKLVPDAKVTE